VLFSKEVAEVKYFKLVIVSVWMMLFGRKGKLKELTNKTVMTQENYLSAETCEKIKGIIDTLVDDAGNRRLWKDSLSSDNRILGFENDIGSLIDEFHIDHWIRAIDEYTGKRTRSWFLMANKLLPRNNNLGSGGGMHRDSAYSHQVKCIWYLSDVGTNNGPFCYVPDSNRSILKTANKYPIGQTRFEHMHDDIVEVVAHQGALVIADTRCIHGGKPIKSGCRYAITLYTSSDVHDKEKRIVNPDAV